MSTSSHSKLHPLIHDFFRATPTWDREGVERAIRRNVAEGKHEVVGSDVLSVRHNESEETFVLTSLTFDQELEVPADEFWKIVRTRSRLSKI